MPSQQDQEANLISHLESLRQMLLRSLAILAIGIIPLFWASPYVLDWFLCTNRTARRNQAPLFFADGSVPAASQNCRSPRLRCMLPRHRVEHLAVRTPRSLRQRKEICPFYRMAYQRLVYCGRSFLPCRVFPLVVRFGMSFAGETLLPVFGVSNLVSLSLWLSFAFGCMFQFPLVTYALVRADVVSYETVCNKRPYRASGHSAASALLRPPTL
jgi:Sec-independent protein secretion pathway component TatC